MKDKASSVIVELPHTNCMRGGHILHEQEYNTRHGIPAILDEVRGETRRQAGWPEVQQEPFVYLLLEGALGWNRGIPGLPVPAAPQPSQPAHRSVTQADPGHAPQEPPPRHGGTVAPAAVAGLHPPSGEPVPGDEKAGPVPAEREETILQAKAVRADDLSRPAYSGGCEGGSQTLYHRPGTPPIPIHCY